jgi:hypothetical protein
MLDQAQACSWSLQARIHEEISHTGAILAYIIEINRQIAHIKGLPPNSPKQKINVNVEKVGDT